MTRISVNITKQTLTDDKTVESLRRQYESCQTIITDGSSEAEKLSKTIKSK